MSDDSFHTVVQGPLAADTVTSPQLDYDLVNHIKGMYRILDLISEQGSSGLGRSLNKRRNSLFTLGLPHSGQGHHLARAAWPPHQ